MKEVPIPGRALWDVAGEDVALIPPECKHLTDTNRRHQCCSTHLFPSGSLIRSMGGCAPQHTQRWEVFRLPRVLKSFSPSITYLEHPTILSTLLGIPLDPFPSQQPRDSFQLPPPVLCLLICFLFPHLLIRNSSGHDRYKQNVRTLNYPLAIRTEQKTGSHRHSPPAQFLCLS